MDHSLVFPGVADAHSSTPSSSSPTRLEGAKEMPSCWATDALPTRAAAAESLLCPFESRLNPNVTLAQARSDAWLRRLYGDTPFTRRTSRARMASFVGGFYPETGVAELALATDYISWAFALDDLGDETPVGRWPGQLAELFESFDEVFQGGTSPASSDRSVVALRDIVDRLSAFSTAAQLEAFREANQAYFGGMLWEANNRAGGWVPDEATFMLFRPAAGAVPPFFTLTEPLESIAISPEVRGHTAVQALTRLAGRIVCWINDVLSYEKERKHGDVHNLAIVYEVHRGLAPSAALRDAIRLNNAEVEEFRQTARSLPSFGVGQDGELKRYVSVLESMMRVTLDWTLGSARYAPVSG